MTTLLPWLLTAILAYLWGSVPYGYLIAKSRGIDIRTVGSRNIGMTNVYRCVGKSAGVATFLCDLLKGILGTQLIPRLVCLLPSAGDPTLGLMLLGGAATVAGHNWTCFLGFKGGKGIASSLGLLVGLAPGVALGAFGVFALVFALFRYISLASISAAATVIAYSLFAGGPVWFRAVLALMGIVAILKHHANIGRLLRHEEPRFSFARKEEKLQ
ncbi:MAG: glycerol-3-phosphate 1-O-acyltransferase PlsY [Kiritimatiellia bacterium]